MHLCSSTGWVVDLPAVEGGVFTLGEPQARLIPQICPLSRIVQFARRIGATARNEARKRTAAGWLTRRVIAQVKAPTNIVAVVWKRAMAIETMEK